MAALGVDGGQRLRAEVLSGMIPSMAGDLVADVVVAVERAFFLSPGTVLAEGKSSTQSLARHLVVWLLREVTGWSYPEIGRRLTSEERPNGFDHTSVMHAHRRADEWVRKHPDAGRVLRRVEQDLLGRPEALELVELKRRAARDELAEFRIDPAAWGRALVHGVSGPKGLAGPGGFAGFRTECVEALLSPEQLREWQELRRWEYELRASTAALLATRDAKVAREAAQSIGFVTGRLAVRGPAWRAFMDWALAAEVPPRGGVRHDPGHGEGEGEGEEEEGARRPARG